MWLVNFMSEDDFFWRYLLYIFRRHLVRIKDVPIHSRWISERAHNNNTVKHLFVFCLHFYIRDWISLVILLDQKTHIEPIKKACRRERQLWHSLLSYNYFTRSYPVLRPPDSVRTSMPLTTRSCRSRNAVSGEHLFIFAHLDEVNLPSKPSHSILTILVCRSFIDT